MRTATEDRAAAPDSGESPSQPGTAGRIGDSPRVRDSLGFGASSQANREQAQHGLAIVKSSILGLLYRQRRGLTNAEICRALDLTAGQDGKMSNMLSWSILGLLVKEGKVRKRGNYYFLG